MVVVLRVADPAEGVEQSRALLGRKTAQDAFVDGIGQGSDPLQRQGAVLGEGEQFATPVVGVARRRR
ncbi:hypothetical protein GCM10010442_66800 [Kitasatospora kifunensis]